MIEASIPFYPGARICAHVKPALRKGETKRIPCKPGTSGRVIKIRLNTKEPLQLCEVQVFGVRGT